MRRYREPLSVPTRPDIGIAYRGVAGARVNDRDISENAHANFLPLEAIDRHRSSGLCEKLFLVDERPVWVRAQEILGQDLVEPLHIAMLHRMDVVAVERSQRIKVGANRRSPEPALRDTAFWSPSVLEPPNAADEVNGSAVHGFVFDFCGVEIDRDTGTVLVDKYVSLHDAGRILNPALFDGQVRGGFAMAVGAALYERLVYVEDGGFVTGSLLDYALPTASMVPELEILHQETPSPVTPLGAKGVAEGNSMSTPACIANAVADALGVAEVSLPLTPERLLEMVRRGGQ
jgi:CO/xanthine dehydrogenase Mo-binding subunit